MRWMRRPKAECPGTARGCAICLFWRNAYDAAQRDADRYATQLTHRGRRPAGRGDAHEPTPATQPLS